MLRHAWHKGAVRRQQEEPLTANFPIDLATALWLGFTGACIGSFLNVVAYRMPLGMSIVWKPSHCPRCQHTIRARDNVPVLGWLWLRGKCRDCAEPISPRYAIVEAMMGAAFFVLAYVELFSGGANLPGGPILPWTGALDNVWNPLWPVIGVYAYHCTLLSFLMCVALIDQDRRRVPLRLLLFAGVVAICCAATFEFLYPLRGWTGLSSNVQAIVDAGVGAFTASLFGLTIVLLGATALRLSEQAKRHVHATNCGTAIAGGFLGLKAALVLWLLWGIGVAVVRLRNKKPERQYLSILWPLWFASLGLVLFWQQIADFLPL